MKMRSIGYKSKNKLLLISALLLCWVAYDLAVNETIEVVKRCRILNEELEKASSASQNVKHLEEKLTQLENSVEIGTALSDNQKDTLLDLISNYCQANQLILIDISKSSFNNQKDFILETNVFTVQGSFQKLISLIYLIEYEKQLTNVVSAHFLVKEETRSKRNNLFATVYLQNIKRKKNEE